MLPPRFGGSRRRSGEGPPTRRSERDGKQCPSAASWLGCASRLPSLPRKCSRIPNGIAPYRPRSASLVGRAVCRAARRPPMKRLRWWLASVFVSFAEALTHRDVGSTGCMVRRVCNGNVLARSAKRTNNSRSGFLWRRRGRVNMRVAESHQRRGEWVLRNQSSSLWGLPRWALELVKV
jgi:hypothetical protein